MKLIFTEDGGMLRVLVLEDNTTEEKHEFLLRVEDIIAQPRIGVPATVGEEFEVMKMRNAGAWGGNWYLRDNVDALA